ncbi:MAG: T9SS type A sorting domain-containing protein [candidate division Zixibacteria bacterium]|nr:T9SS type A sorting domain-containing protein [Candidatus Tariuqbacter arcticus]
MKKFTLTIILFLSLILSGTSFAVQVDGYCYLENQTSHDSTKILFQADSPGAVTDSTYTNTAGYYQIDLAQGGYDVFFTHEGYYDEEILDQLFFSSTTLDSITLNPMPVGIPLSGSISGILEDTSYVVMGDIAVNAGDSLIIQPGANLFFEEDIEFHINGYIYAVGIEEDSIKFVSPVGAPAWGGIKVNDSADDSSKFGYCVVSNIGFYANTTIWGIQLNYANPTIYNCTIHSNYGWSQGGGVYCNNSNPIIVNCTFWGNGGVYNGGGIYCVSSNPIISNCAIFANGGEHGGGIYLTNSSPTISNCTLSGNGGLWGGGIYCISSSPIVVNTIIEGTDPGSGICFEGSSNADVSYCDISNNEYGSFSGSVPSYLGQIVMVNANGDSCDTFFNIFLDPIFYSTIGDSAYYLTENSPCIDAGDPDPQYYDPDGTVADMGAIYFDQSGILSLEVTSPNGGETWEIGDTPTIEWTVIGEIDSFDVLLSRDNGAEWDTLDTGLPGDTTQWIWEAGVTPPESDSCLVKIIGYYGVNQTFDMSDSVFCIVLPPEIGLTSPNGGETWEIGDTPTIEWNVSGIIDSFDVLLSRNNGAEWDTLDAGLAGDTTQWTWEAGVTPPESDSCLVKIVGYYGTNQTFDTSDSLFCIVQPPALEVAYPNGGETWQVGGTPTITWTHDPGFDSFDVLLSRDNGAEWDTLADGLSAFANSWTWNTGVTLPESDSCLVKIMGYYGANLTFDLSDDVFTIEALTQTGPDTLWTSAFGGLGDDEGYFVLQTPEDGGNATVGYASVFGSEVYLVKNDADGNLEWQRTYGGNYDDCGYCVQRTQDGGYIITGYTVPSTVSPSDVYLIKTNTDGIEEWNQTFGGGNEDVGYSVRQTSDGGYIIVGFYTSFLDSADVYLIKTDSNGNEQWHRTFGGSGLDIGHSVRQTADEGYIIAGYTSSYGAGATDVYIIKTDSTGDEEWSQTIGNTAEEIGYSIQQTTDGGYIITGFTASYGAGSYDVYLIKLNSLGNGEWYRTFGGIDEDVGRSVRQTDDGGYIIAGYTASFGAGPSDFYLIKTDPLGNEVWSQFIGGDDAEKAYCVELVPNGGYSVAGFTESYGAGAKDVWLVRLGSELPPMMVDLTPHNTPIVIPADGGSFTFDIDITNITPIPQQTDIWTQIILPNMAAVPIINVYDITIFPTTISRERIQIVPAAAPGGIYTYRAYVGDYPWVVDDSDWFTFEKLGDGGEGGFSSPSDWPCLGELFDGEEAVHTLIPETYALHAPYPNPFNPKAILVYSLPEDLIVSVVIYDIQGREVVRLIDELQPAGIHEIVFDASGFSSGIYFARLMAGNFHQTKKLLLVK